MPIMAFVQQMDYIYVMTKVIIILSVIFIYGCISSYQLTQNCPIPENPEYLSTNNGFPYFWREADFPILVKIDSSIETNKAAAILEAIDYWNFVSGAQIFQERFVSHEDLDLNNPKNKKIISIIMNELGKSENGNNLLGVAASQTSIIGEIISVKISLDDDTHYRLLPYVTMHELGHAIGLRHDECQIESIMYPYPLSSDKIIQEEDIQYVRSQMAVLKN